MGRSAYDKSATKLIDELAQAAKETVYTFKDIAGFDETHAILRANPKTQLGIVREYVDRIGKMRRRLGDPNRNYMRYWNVHRERGFPCAAREIVARLLTRKLPFTTEDLVFLINRTADLEIVSFWCLPYVPQLVRRVEQHFDGAQIPTRLTRALVRLRASLSSVGNAAEQKLCAHLGRICQRPRMRSLESGEAWSDAALSDLKLMKPIARTAWNDLIEHCRSATGNKPPAKWLLQAEKFLRAIKFPGFKKQVLKWLPLIDKPRTKPIDAWSEWQPNPNLLIIDPHVGILKGLLWCCGFKEAADIARTLMRVALSSYKKIPLKGPRLVSLGNACVTALGMMPGLAPIGQLAVLKVKVKFGTAQKEIEKAFNAAAAREGLPREEIEELAVPAYGLDEVGTRRKEFGEYQAELSVVGSSAAVLWSKDGKPFKSVPAAVKKDHAADWKELQTTVKDINTMLPAQRERIDMLFLAQKSWTVPVWRERYLDHPLIGVIARRLIWSFDTKRGPRPGIWHGDRIVGDDGKSLKIELDSAVSLWHPIGHPMESVLTWRSFIERYEIVQPFKQAHREVYLLTGAERRTGSYSNRFAAHVLRQHQFNALCAARGWKNKLRLLVDDTYPPAHRRMPAWNIRAEYWIEGAGTEYGQDTNESGVFLYLTTDQVRFYALVAAQAHAHAAGGGYAAGGNQVAEEPLALEQVPALVFSEIMRDVDLFVGVASVGNDPNWSDGGPTGQYREYWQSYSFGELSATAQTRRAILEKLIPRLKIADRCKLSDRFLEVRGDIRTYKIHLGSGNILMMPNDQYLCIVPKQTVGAQGRVLLPFEGDSTLSVILSKAFLLAEDRKITDTTITSQLEKK